MDEVAAGGAPESPQGWEALALLAVMTAVVAALPARSRRAIRKRLSLVVDDWERGTAPLPEAVARASARRLLRPILTQLESEEALRP